LNAVSPAAVDTGDALPLSGALPELASVYWRPRVSDRSLRRDGRLWTAVTTAHTLPFIATAIVLGMLKPITIPVSVILLAHAWIIPGLYAARGANVVAPRPPAGAPEERVSVGLLGDLLGHDARQLQRATGLVLERGALGVWVIGEAGALLVRPGGRRVHCYCVKVAAPELPSGDRIAHLLLALRTDEAGFATLANLAFSGGRWRLRRRLAQPARQALDVAAIAARSESRQVAPLAAGIA
jgi:hypothetical protein